MKLVAVPAGYVASKMPEMQDQPPSPIMAFVIQSAGETILFDTGIIRTSVSIQSDTGAASHAGGWCRTFRRMPTS